MVLLLRTVVNENVRRILYPVVWCWNGAYNKGDLPPFWRQVSRSMRPATIRTPRTSAGRLKHNKRQPFEAQICAR